MAKKKKGESEPDVKDLIQDILHDAQQLMGQQLDLLRSEVREEVGHVRDAAVSGGSGAGLLALGGVLAAQMAVHGLHRSARLPLWVCYGLVGGLAGAGGWGLLRQASRQVAAVGVAPRETTNALKENLQWLKEQAPVTTA